MPVSPNSQMPTLGDGSDPRIREGVSDKARINQRPSSPYPMRNKPARTQRKTSAHENDDPTRRPRSHIHRRNHSSDAISSDSDSSLSSSIRLQRGLKFPFNFKQTIVEEKVLAAAGPRVAERSDYRREAKERRRQLYRERIQSFVHSQYDGDVYARGEPTIDLFTRSAHENKELDAPELMTWM